MEPTTALSVSAQIAVAIAGFTGVVAAFRNDPVRDWGPVEEFWLRLLLVNSILPLAFSMIGLIVLSATDPSPAKWRWCSGLAKLFPFPCGIIILKTVVGFAPGQLEALGGTRFTSYALVTTLTVVCLLQLWNLATLTAFWPFFGAIVALLFGAMYQFVRLVLSPRRLETRSGGTANRIIRRSAAELDSAQIGFRTGEFHVASGHPCDVLADVALDHFERYAATRNAVPHRSAVLLRLCTGLGVNASAFVAVRLTHAPLRTGRDVSVPACSRAA